jgi:hypothetical protein
MVLLWFPPRRSHADVVGHGLGGAIPARIVHEDRRVGAEITIGVTPYGSHRLDKPFPLVRPSA